MQSQTRRSFRDILILSVAASGLFGAPAFAQTQSEETDAEDIVVTGSRIQGIAAPAGANVVTVGRDEIIASGATTTADLLKTIPQITVIGFNAEGSAGPAAASNVTGGTAPNLRGAGPTATLVVLDGQRVSAAGTMGQFVDPSFLPPLALQQIEVVADGSSAIYGSDAVAGVVNLIPRRNFKGVEINAGYGIADSYNEYQAGAVVGNKWDGGSAMVAVDYTTNTNLWARDRDFVMSDRSSFGGANTTSQVCEPGTLTVGTTAYRPPAPGTLAPPVTSLTPGAQICDPARRALILNDTNRASVYTNMNQDLSSSVRLFANAFYSKRESTSQAENTFSALAIPVGNPYRPSGVVPTATFSGVFRDSPLNQIDTFATTYQAQGGIEFDVSTFKVKLAGTYGESEDQINRSGGIDTFHRGQLLASTNPATALNVFGGNSQQVIDTLLQSDSIIQGDTSLKTLEASTNGTLFALPGGPARVALGVEYREETLAGALTSDNPLNGVARVAPSANKRDMYSLFGELFLPVIGGESGRPGLRKLEFSAAVRYEEYSDFGNTTNPKVGVNWAPIDDLTFRGSYGTSFRAPGLSENDPTSSGANLVNLGATQTTSLADGRLVRPAVLAGGNPDLQPETATTWTMGFDLKPKAVPGLRFSVSYFNLSYENRIIDPFGQITLYLNNPSLLPGRVGFQGDANFAALATLFQNAPFTPTTPIVYTLPDLVLFNARRANLAVANQDGLDVQANYRVEVAEGTAISLGANAAYNLSYEEGTSPTAAPIDRLNQLGFPVEFQARAFVGVQKGGVSARATLNHVGDRLNNNSIAVPKINSSQTVDLDFNYMFGAESPGVVKGVRLGLNVRNAFDTPPPKADVARGYDATYSSALGRIISVSLNKRF